MRQLRAKFTFDEPVRKVDAAGHTAASEQVAVIYDSMEVALDRWRCNDHGRLVEEDQRVDHSRGGEHAALAGGETRRARSRAASFDIRAPDVDRSRYRRVLRGRRNDFARQTQRAPGDQPREGEDESLPSRNRQRRGYRRAGRLPSIAMMDFVVWPASAMGRGAERPGS